MPCRLASRTLWASISKILVKSSPSGGNGLFPDPFSAPTPNTMSPWICHFVLLPRGEMKRVGCGSVGRGLPPDCSPCSSRPRPRSCFCGWVSTLRVPPCAGPSEAQGTAGQPLLKPRKPGGQQASHSSNPHPCFFKRIFKSQLFNALILGLEVSVFATKAVKHSNREELNDRRGAWWLSRLSLTSAGVMIPGW